MRQTIIKNVVQAHDLRGASTRKAVDQQWSNKEVKGKFKEWEWLAMTGRPSNDGHDLGKNPR